MHGVLLNLSARVRATHYHHGGGGAGTVQRGGKEVLRDAPGAQRRTTCIATCNDRWGV